MTNKKIASEIAIGIILLVAIAIGGIFYWQNKKATSNMGHETGSKQKACTMEAKLCDDGSYVGRTGPNCEFAPCPTESNCANEGKQVRANRGGFPVKCCFDLKAMYGSAREDCSVPDLPGDIGICSNCGNSVCEGQNNENKCNCPQDCTDKNTTAMANPASVYCEQNGGKLEIRTAPDGGQTGYCKFSNGSECEEWAYFRKECGNENGNLKTYKNEKYKFQLTFPKRWKGYNVSYATGESKYLYADDTIDFNLKSGPSYNVVFNISVYPLKWWENNAELENKGAYIKGSEHTMGDYLGTYISKNSNYAFTYRVSQDDEGYDGFPEVIPNQLYKGPFYDVEKIIIPTFKFIN